MTAELRATPVVLLGAARSGTKLLRDCLALDPRIAKVPHDINYVWRLGNEELTHDELAPSDLTPQATVRIRGHLARFAADRHLVVEKTVSNCLRVPFVAAVLPEARYVHLVRDGRDVAESVERQWLAKPDWLGMLRKARTFPMLQSPGYAVRYAEATMRRATGRADRKAVWGPRYAGMDADLATEDLLTVCARQWARCVERTMEGLAMIAPERVHTVRYETFVTDPVSTLSQVGSFLGVDFDLATVERVASTASASYIGKGVETFGASGHERALAALIPCLGVLGYHTGP